MRRTIRIDEHGHVRMEGNPQEEVWMTLAEIADLFNLPAATVGREIKAIRKTGVLVDCEACKYIRKGDGCSGIKTKPHRLFCFIVVEWQ